MKPLTSFQSLGFTRNEVKVILVLIATLLCGLALRSYTSRMPSEMDAEARFDYSAADSIFRQRSASVPSAPASGEPADSTRPRTAFASKPPLPAGSHINLNTATADELTSLPGIGPAYARRIVAYREENGPFSSVDDLERVKGIGPKKMERLRPHVSIK